MKIVTVCAWTTGIAHTNIAKEKLIRAAASMAHTIKVETQGTIGTEDELTAEEIKEADVVILAVDIAITGTERYDFHNLQLLSYFSFGCLLPLSLCSNHTPAFITVFIKRGLFNVAFFFFFYDIFSIRAF